MTLEWMTHRLGTASLGVAACLFHAAIVGCGSAANSAAQTSARTNTDEPADRVTQVVAMGRSGDRNHMNAVIGALSDESIDVRRAAATAAKRLVGGAIPFRADGSADYRARQVDAYERLWQRAQETDTDYLIDLVPVIIEDLENEDEQVRELAARDIVVLTGVTYGLRADQSPEIRRAIAKHYRDLWTAWNEPGSPILELKRHPEKLPAYQQQRRAVFEQEGGDS